MIPVKIQGVPYNFPQNWDELSVYQYAEIAKFRKELNPLRVLSILTGIDYRALLNFDGSEFERNVLPLLNFIGEEVELSAFTLPDVIHIDGNPYKVPKDFTGTWGQKIFLQTRINEAIKNGEPIYSLIPFTLATIFQPIVEGVHYDDTRAAEFEKRVRWCKLVEAYPVTTFFLRKYITLSKEKPRSSDSSRQTSKKLQEYKSSTRSGFWGRLTRWRKATP